MLMRLPTLAFSVPFAPTCTWNGAATDPTDPCAPRSTVPALTATPDAKKAVRSPAEASIDAVLTANTRPMEVVGPIDSR